MEYRSAKRCNFEKSWQRDELTCVKNEDSWKIVDETFQISLGARCTTMTDQTGS
jgi:hypothetical protein